MKKILAFITMAAMLTAFAGCGQKVEEQVAEDKAVETAAVAESDFDYIQGKKVMNIGITLFAPMNYEEDGKLIGFETEFAEAVCEKLGVEPNFVEIDWNSKEIELNSKNIDCIWNGMTITDDRKANMSISTPYMENKQVMVAKAENADKYTESVDGANIVAESGSAGEELANDNEFFANGKFTAVDSQAKAFMDVASGTSDVAIVDYVASIGSIGEGTDYEDLVVVESQSFNPEEYGIAFRKGSDMTEKVNAAMKELAEEGKLAEIGAKYKLDELLIVK